MQLDWKSAFTFYTRDPDWKRKLFIGGLLFYPFPPLGWVMALGYRSLVGIRIVEGAEPLLPPWRGNYRNVFLRGVKASGIILSHFTPFFLLYWVFGLHSPADAQLHADQIVIFFALIALSPPVFLPTLPLYYWWEYPWVSFSLLQSGVLLLLFFGAVFILPASFVHVGLYGKFSAGLKARSAWRFVMERPRVYAEAWILSLAVSAVAISIGLFIPWGLFWSYLVILHLFVDALSHWDIPEVHERFKDSKLFETK